MSQFFASGIIILVLSFAPFLAKAESSSLGVSANDIVLGSTGVMSGDDNWGEGLCFGAQAYFKKANIKGIHGRKIRLICMDDRYDPKVSYSNLQQMLEKDGIFALMSGTGTPNANAMMPLLEKKGVPYLFPLTGGESLRTPVRKNVFTLRISYAQEAAILIDHAIKNLKLKSVGIMFQDDAFGNSGRAGVQSNLQKYSMNIQSSGSYQRGTANVEAAVAALSAAKPDGVYLQATLGPSLAFIKKAAEKGYRPVYFASSTNGVMGLLDGLKGEKAEIYLTEVVPVLSPEKFPIVREFAADLAAYGKGKVGPETLEGYTQAAMVAKAIELAGATLTREGLIAALENLRDHDLGGIKVSFSPTNHQGFSKAYVYHIKDGVAKLIGD